MLNERAIVHRLSGEIAWAEEGHQRSLELSRAIGSAPDEGVGSAGSVVTAPTAVTGWGNLRRPSILTGRLRCAGASFPERHKYLARFRADFCHLIKPNLMQSNTVTPMQHEPCLNIH